jgi:hypothetical protein
MGGWLELRGAVEGTVPPRFLYRTLSLLTTNSKVTLLFGTCCALGIGMETYLALDTVKCFFPGITPWIPYCETVRDPFLMIYVYI